MMGSIYLFSMVFMFYGNGKRAYGRFGAFWYLLSGFLSDGQNLTDMVALGLGYSLQCSASLSRSSFFVFHFVTCVRLFLPLFSLSSLSLGREVKYMPNPSLKQYIYLYLLRT